MIRRLIAVALALACSGAFASIPVRFNYQARLTDSGGTPLTGTHNVAFAIYSGGSSDVADSGDLLYSEAAVIQVTNGVINHIVGTGTVVFGTLDESTFSADATRFLQITIDASDELLPRLQIGAVPFAIRALNADHADSADFATSASNSNALGGIPPAGFSLANHFHNSLSASDGTPASAVYVDVSGNVGVGRTNPSEALDVNGDVRIETSIAVGNGTTPTQILHDLGNSRFRIGESGDSVDQRQEQIDSYNALLSAWQDFTPGVSGKLFRVEITRGGPGENGGAGVLSILDGAVTLTSAPLSATPVARTLQSVDLSPVSLTAGHKYRIDVQCSSEINAWNGKLANVYPGGDSSSGSGVDRWFRTYMQGGTPAIVLADNASTVSVPGSIAVSRSVTTPRFILGPAAGDPPALMTFRTVPDGQGQSQEVSELVLFSGNDAYGGFGPDLITLRAPQLRLQTYNDPSVADPDNPLSANDRLVVDTTGTVSVYKDFQVLGSAFKPGGGDWATLSDARLKKNIETITGALEKLLSLRGVIYEWKNPKAYGGTNQPLMGMIADEVERVFPQWVHRDVNGTRVLSIVGFEGLTAEAFKELLAKLDCETRRTAALKAKYETEIREHESELNELTKELSTLRQELDRLDN